MSRQRTPPKRFYAQWKANHPEDEGSDGMWCVYDRQWYPINPTADGDCDSPIAHCVNRYVAFRVRDALNALEEKK